MMVEPVNMFYILYGQDNFSLHRKLVEIKSGIGNPEMLDLNTNVLNGQQISSNQLQNACSAVPFMHTFRLVIVEGLLERFNPEKKPAKNTNKVQSKLKTDFKEWQEFGNYIKEMPSSTVLVLVDGEIDAKRNMFLNQMSSLAKVHTFPRMKRDALGGWIRKRITEGGGSAAPAVIELLEKLIGGDLWNLSNEIEKLIVYCNGRLIMENDVMQVTSYTREANIFTLVDSILERRRKEAQQLLYRLFHAGEAPIYVLNMVNRQLRLVVLVKELSATLSHQQIMDQLGIYQDWRLNILLRQSKSYTFERLREAYNRILEADVAIKIGKYDDDLALDLLVVDLCKI